ncbi:flagellar L-ring protein [Polymorphobacter multimanifer]|uniref:Flagellar L-ring protein n=1 Tax=Polymorphobacter multimanifer TaxID=1070431 RepID=A0A841LC21_9SPHN|nr:flagellar basal body L-ring protein FlgH [Polymorphobacter multimanifer]MBB6226692.1 flagellar L-ring protein precursor FlgH [Polymorphobacter multimanifer]GGI82554.1 flagellar L-ring protein [Polymorphobacter multimanifer]
MSPKTVKLRTVSLLALVALLPACSDEGFGRARGIAATLPLPAPPLTPDPPALTAPGGFTGSLYHPSRYVGLASDRRAGRVGDLVTIRLIERTQARKSSSADSARSSDNALNLPAIPPLTLIPEAATRGGSTQNFTGSGSAAQDNQLIGELTVTVAEVLPGGVLRVAGEKRLTLNRGEEQIQLTGLIRIADLGFDNSIPSTRVADARIRYAGTGQIADQGKQGWLARFFAKVSPL